MGPNGNSGPQCKNVSAAFFGTEIGPPDFGSGLNFPKTTEFSRKCCSSAFTRFLISGMVGQKPREFALARILEVLEDPYQSPRIAPRGGAIVRAGQVNAGLHVSEHGCRVGAEGTGGRISGSGC